MLDCEDLLRVPYKDDGRDLTGLDCVGLVIEVRKRLNKPYIDFNDYSRIASNACETHSLPVGFIRIPEAIPGCIIAFDMRHTKKPDHIGIVLPGHKFIHATFTSGICIADFFRKPWVNLIEGYYEYNA